MFGDKWDGNFSWVMYGYVSHTEVYMISSKPNNVNAGVDWKPGVSHGFAHQLSRCIMHRRHQIESIL